MADTRLGHPERTRINDNLGWQHADHKRWGHPKKCLERKIKSAECKRERERNAKSKIHMAWVFFSSRFGSPWVFPGKFNLSISEPFTLNSPQGRSITVICCPRSPPDHAIKIPIKSDCFLFLKVKLCLSRWKGTWTWTLERRHMRQETHPLWTIEGCCPFRFPPQAALVWAALSWRVYYSLESQSEPSQGLGGQTLATRKEGWGHGYNISTQDTEAMGFVGLKPAWST